MGEGPGVRRNMAESQCEWRPIDERPKESVPIIVGEWQLKADSTWYWSTWSYMSNDPWLNSKGRSHFYQPTLPGPPPHPKSRPTYIYTGIL